MYHPSSQLRSRVRRLNLLLIGALLTLLIVSCSTVAPTPQPSSDTTTSHLLTVTPTAEDTKATLEAQYGGQVVAWEPGVYAIIGLDKAGSGLAAQSTAEVNSNTFEAGAAWMSGRSNLWAGGRSNMWAGGRSNMWAGGRSNMWAGGQFTWLPENTALWQQVRLEQGQTLASNLGYGIKVAVIDTGVDVSHPALLEALAPASEWWDFYSDDALPQEEGVLGEGGYGHGSNVAGIIRQVAPRATILPLRVLGPDGRGSVADLVAAIQWAVDKGANIINLSLGSTSFSSSVSAALLNASYKGVFVVASTGNTGDERVTYPASYATLPFTGWLRLSVTSVDARDIKSSFATYGYNVEVAAPGESVFGPAPQEQVAAWTGTSMAAPMVSGALALALGQELTVSRTDLMDKLKNSSADVDNLSANRSFAYKLGKGRLNIEEFLRDVIKY
jgi:thermitase